MATVTTTVVVNPTVTRQAQKGIVRDARSGSGAIREAVVALSKVDATMDENIKAIKARDNTLANDIQEFRLEYEEYLRSVVKYAQRTRNVARANINILANDGAQALLVIAGQKFGDSTHLLEKAKWLQTRADELRARLSTLSSVMANSSWTQRLLSGLLILGSCAAAVITLPFALPVEIAIGASLGVAVVGAGIYYCIHQSTAQIGVGGVAETSEKLKKIENQMKAILMAASKGQAKAECLEDLRQMFEENPNLCEVLVEQVKAIYDEMVVDCTEMEKIATENYFKNGK